MKNSFACRHQGKTSDRAFSLVELLVSIFIIALLVSLLFPNVGKMRNSALASKCASNLRQVYVAEKMFAADNGNRIGSASAFLPDANGNPSTVFMSWSDWLVGTGGRPSYLNGPTATKNVSRPEYNVLFCPSADPKSYSAGSSSIYLTYGMLHSPGSVMLAGYDISTWIHDGWHFLNMVPAPSKIPLFADTVVYTGSNLGKQWYYWYPHRIAENGGIHLRHNNRANVCFYDGHVASLGKDDLAALNIKAAISSDYQALTLTNPNP